MRSLFYSAERMAQAMDEAGIQALVANTAPNIQYLTGYRRGGDSLAIVRRDDLAHPDLVVNSTNLDYDLEDPHEAVGIHAFGFFARTFTEGALLDEREAFVKRMHHASAKQKSRWDVAADLLRSGKLMSSRIGVDGTLDSAAPLVTLLPDLQVISVPDHFRRLRMVKTGEEVERLAEAARITEQAILASALSASLGTTQRQLARTYSQAVIAANAYVRSDNASIGRGSALGNLNSPRDLVEVGSILRYDVGAHYEGYASDLARCFAFEQVGEKAQRIYSGLLSGFEKELTLIRPGVAACEVFEATIAEVRRAGIRGFERHHVGHGIGIAGAGYDPPLLSPADRTLLEPGMVLCVEVPYVEVGYGGLQLEDMLVVTRDGYQLLSHADRSLRVLP